MEGAPSGFLATALPPGLSLSHSGANSLPPPRPPSQFKFADPEEAGGRPVVQWALEMAPPPLEWEGQQNTEGWWPIYSGPERSCQVKRLQPGVRYAARVKVCAVSVCGGVF